ncbi:MAG: hypothetical protein ABH864_01710 [archaeon]
MNSINKKGQGVFGMSFSTIFSIIIIIFILLVAFLVIRHFADLSKCTNVGLYYDDLREEVRDAWTSTSGRYLDEFTAKVPKKGMFGAGVEYVCFGNLTDTPTDADSTDMQESLEREYLYDPTEGYNVFMYPPDNACESNLGAIVLKCGSADCATTDGRFFCQPIADDGTVSVYMYKQPTEYKITLMRNAP